MSVAVRLRPRSTSVHTPRSSFATVNRSASELALRE
jgi:hypothetical protein